VVCLDDVGVDVRVMLKRILKIFFFIILDRTSPLCSHIGIYRKEVGLLSIHDFLTATCLRYTYLTIITLNIRP
jgi:hypothetical protein